MTVHVKIEGEVAEQLDRLVAEGGYTSRDEVIIEALRLVQERDGLLRMVDEKVAEGRADIAAGRVHDMDDVFAELKERYLTWPR